jgi:hypothetical protein
MLYFDLAGFEGGLPALHCALQGIRPERLIFTSDYPQNFMGVNTDTGKGMRELRNHMDTESCPSKRKPKRDLGRYGAGFVKVIGAVSRIAVCRSVTHEVPMARL